MSAQGESHSAWMDAFFASYYAHRPVNATFIGERGHDHWLPDLSASGVGDLLADTADLLARGERGTESASGGDSAGAASVSAIADGADPHSAAGEIDRRVARGFLKLQDWELRSRHFQGGNPSLYTGEAVFSVMAFFLNHSGSVGDRIDAATARMHAIPEFLAQGRENVRSAPGPWTERAIRECDGALRFFTEGVAALNAEYAEEAGLAGLASFSAAADVAARAFSEHRAHLASHLLSRTSQEFAAGDEALDLYLREGHFLPRSAEELVRYAQVQMGEAQAYLEEHAGAFGVDEPREALAGLADLHPDAAGYYDRYQKIWDAIRQVSDQRELLSWPDFPIRYVPRPSWSRAAAPHLYFLFYRSPAAINRPEVHDYLVMPLEADAAPADTAAFLRANNDSVIKLNHVVHHGGIGHHVQNWHAFRAESRIGRVAAVDCASRIAMFCGGTMAEGWACYATDLAAEAGALTPLEQYAEVHSRVRMAARTIVDVKLHHGEMTLEDAAAFYQARAGMSSAAAFGEAVKNSMFPGAAVMYLMGTDAIHELRHDMMAAEGNEFELRRFHDTFLSYGSVPVSLIADDMRRRVEDVE